MDMKPSEIFRRNMYACMIEEPVGLSLYPLIGADRIFAETDYPHPDTTFPFVQETFDDVFRGIPEEVVEAVSHANAERVFQWKMADEGLVELNNVYPARAQESPAGILRRSDDRQICQHVGSSPMGLPCGLPIGPDGQCEAGHRASHYAAAGHQS
jgi:hypothetical protein